MQQAHTGLPDDEARLAARRRLGSPVHYREEARRMTGFGSLVSVGQDLRFVARSLRREPLFAGFVVVTLALGIGANAAMFGVVDRLLLRGPEHVWDPGRMVRIYLTDRPEGMREYTTGTLGYVSYQALRAGTHSFDGLAVYNRNDVTMGRGAEARELKASYVTASYFPLLRVQPILGRFFDASEDATTGAQPVVVISYGLWQDYFGGDPDVVGKTIPGWDAAWGRTIIGVMPPDFWVHPSMAGVKGWFAFNVGRFPGARAQTLARLKPGVDHAQAEAELTTIATSIEAAGPNGADAQDWRIRLEPLHDIVTAGYKETLYLLLGAVAFVLLISALNVANLQLSRSVTRQSEMATRVALGAGRARLIRQLLTENVLLALIGGVLGIAVAYVGVWVFVTLAPGFYPPSQDITIRPAVLLFTFGVSVATGILAGLFPALRISRPDWQDALKQSARGGASGIRQGVRRALVVIEVAMALVLLVGAGLMINSYARVMRVDMGFGSDRLLTMEINLSGLSRYRTRRNAAHFSVTPQVAGFYREVMERVKNVPGVRSVGVTSGLPPRTSMTVPFRVVGQAGDPSDEFRNAQYYEVSADFFETMGIGLRRGRTFTDADGENAAGVAVINETLARQYFGDGDALGQIIEARINRGNASLADDRPREIVARKCVYRDQQLFLRLVDLLDDMHGTLPLRAETGLHDHLGPKRRR